ncbi:MAG: hypothetical protein CMF96_11190 [Candidatus Marinimicrobia bacterium]|nr:hypothetical protein [Candidatus Neomarinimicrobiota bacterium]
MGHICEPSELEKIIPRVIKEKDKFKEERKYWAKKSGWKFDGKNSKRILYMIKFFILNGKKKQIEDIQ